MSYVYGEIRRRREIQVLMQWLSLCKQQALEETLSGSKKQALQNQEEVFQKKITEIQSMLEVSEKKSKETQESLQYQSRVAGVTHLQKILSTHQILHQLCVFMQWRHRASELKIMEEKEEAVNALQTRVDTVRDSRRIKT